MSHRGARLAVFDRRLLADRVCLGRPVAHMAGEMGVSRRTGHKWMCRWRAEGDAGGYDRPSRPHTTPHRTSPGLKRRCADCGTSGEWSGRWSRVRWGERNRRPERGAAVDGADLPARSSSAPATGPASAPVTADRLARCHGAQRRAGRGSIEAGRRQATRHRHANR
ncbi:leucine zipper domain-containing protein [Streptomyces rimosus]|uniref:leucine zipper domain-containing protein n=1 Tax=Streptomyces rimosus TaxID=1927 RepID=UPI00131B062E